MTGVVGCVQLTGLMLTRCAGWVNKLRRYCRLSGNSVGRIVRHVLNVHYHGLGDLFGDNLADRRGGTR